MKEEKQPQYTQGEMEVVENQNCFAIRSKESKEVLVYRVNATTMNPAKNKANAQRIAKAVNMHDKLIDLAHNYLIRLEALQLANPTQAKKDEIRITKELLKQAPQK